MRSYLTEHICVTFDSCPLRRFSALFLFRLIVHARWPRRTRISNCHNYNSSAARTNVSRAIRLFCGRPLTVIKANVLENTTFIDKISNWAKRHQFTERLWRHICFNLIVFAAFPLFHIFLILEARNSKWIEWILGYGYILLDRNCYLGETWTIHIIRMGHIVASKAKAPQSQNSYFDKSMLKFSHTTLRYLAKKPCFCMPLCPTGLNIVSSSLQFVEKKIYFKL